MTHQEINAIILHARSAPLANMDHAAAVDQLLRKLAQHFAPVSDIPEGDKAGAQSTEPVPDE